MEVASSMPVLQSNRSMTKYCDIFDCYWGNSKYLDDNEIIKNRNEFVEELNIKKSKKKIVIILNINLILLIYLNLIHSIVLKNMN